MSAEDILAMRRDIELERRRLDDREAAGELLIDVPEPGTDAAKLMAAARILRGQRDGWERQAEDFLASLRATRRELARARKAMREAVAAIAVGRECAVHGGDGP